MYFEYIPLYIGSDFALVLTINDLRVRISKAPEGAPGKPGLVGSGGSMVAKLKLKGIDGKAPPGVEPVA